MNLLGLIIIIAAFAAAAYIRIAPVRLSVVNFGQLKLSRSGKHNHYLVCPKDQCAEQAHITSKIYPISPAQLRAAWEKVAGGAPRTVAVGDTEASSEQISYVQRSVWLGFPDVITIQITAAEGGSTHSIFSRSVYGRSDFGVNRKRIENWLTRLDKQISDL